MRIVWHLLSIRAYSLIKYICILSIEFYECHQIAISSGRVKTCVCVQSMNENRNTATLIKIALKVNKINEKCDNSFEIYQMNALLISGSYFSIRST